MQDVNGTQAKIPAKSVARFEARGFTVVGAPKTSEPVYTVSVEKETLELTQAYTDQVEVQAIEGPADSGTSSDQGDK
jgi:hypothetical protein